MKLAQTKKIFHLVVPNTLLIAGLLLFTLSLVPFLRDEVLYWYRTSRHQTFSLVNKESQKSVFARFLKSGVIGVEPVNKDFSIVIEKIGLNAPIVADVPVSDFKEYNEALKKGIAHAASSQYPSKEPSNVYLFAHSSLNFWSLGKYAQAFNLLRKLETGDKIHVFYEGEDFVYEVVGKENYKGFNTYPLNRSVLQPVLTLQTCDPPGTTLNRLVVTAKLIEARK